MKIYAIIATIGLALTPISYAGAVDGAIRGAGKVITGAGKTVKVVKPRPVEVPRTSQGGGYQQEMPARSGGGRPWWGRGGDSGSDSNQGYGQQPSQPIQMPCPSCGGKGQVPGALWGTNTCDQCRGSGVIVIYP